MDSGHDQAYDSVVFKTWLMTEAEWRHNRLHLVLAVVAITLLATDQHAGSVAVATVVVGTLLIRIYVWDLQRTDARLALRRVPRHDG
jgi:hypothetical protein